MKEILSPRVKHLPAGRGPGGGGWVLESIHSSPKKPGEFPKYIVPNL